MDRNPISPIMSRADYLVEFTREITANERQKEALKQAHEIRQFEIDLYWKRAAYFWTFIAAAFAGYFVLQKDGSQHVESISLIACLGFLFSVAWYFVNRGSKAWQRNWESHIDLLEDEIMGPLYKTLLNRADRKFWDFTDAYPFSPTKINQLVGLFVIVVWLFLICSTIRAAWFCSRFEFWECVVMSVLTILASASLFVWGRTGGSGRDLSFSIEHRNYK